MNFFPSSSSSRTNMWELWNMIAEIIRFFEFLHFIYSGIRYVILSTYYTVMIYILENRLDDEVEFFGTLTPE